MTNATWKWFAASVRGFDHVEAALPCQDAHTVRVAGADCLIVVVSDGAGSAKHSEQGSRLLCDELSSWLAECVEAHRISTEVLDAARIRHWVEQGIDAARAKLVSAAREEGGSLADFHATVVGAVVDRSGGAFFHIGDGAALATTSTDLRKFALSPAENGEYANETYFYTQEEWRARLRVSPIDSHYDLIAVMSDGITAVALSKGGQSPFEPFLAPVSKFLAESDEAAGNAGITELLSRDSLKSISGDDKTLVWAKRVVNE